MKSKINFSILLAIFPVVFFAGAVLFFAQNSGAQVDIEACQSEYSKRRNQCIADDSVCSAPCRELQGGDTDALARCYAPCNQKRVVCDEAAIDEQRKCAGVWPYNQGAGSDLPVVDAQPNPADAPAAQPPKTSAQPAATPVVPPEQPAGQSKRTTSQPSPSPDTQPATTKSSEDPTGQLIPQDIIINGVAYEPALVDTAPKDSDLGQYFGKDAPPYDSQGRLQFVVRNLDGSADMQLADGTWVEVQEGSIIPYGAAILTGYAATAELESSNHLVIVLRSLSEINVEQFVKDASVYRTELKLETGELRFKVLEPDLKTDMRVQTPNTTASPAGTDFGVSYNKETDTSVWEIYDKSITVTNTAGETATISSSYGSPIRRVKIGSDGAITEKVAIPKDEWTNFAPQNQNTRNTSAAWIWVAVFLFLLASGLGCLAYFKRDVIAKIFKKSSIP